MMFRMIFLVSLCLFTISSDAQIYELYCSKWTDLNNKSTRGTPSTVYIDSSMITIEQGESHLYLEVKSQERNENVFLYNVIDYNDAPCTAIFQPEEMIFDFKSNEYWLRYSIDSISRPNAESIDTVAADTSSTAEEDSVEEEDNTIYEKADLMPEYPGGKEEMIKFIDEKIRAPKGPGGMVTVEAVVEKDGTLTSVKSVKETCAGCGAEAVRVVKMMPSWIPGEIGDEYKRVKIKITVIVAGK